jgi:outer membrane lipoprotein SlyB
MSETQRRIHPLTAAAAIAVIVFSAVGVAVMTGAIPSSTSREAPAPIAATEAPAPKPAAAEPAPVTRAAPSPAAEPAPARRAAPAKEPVRKSAPAEQRVAQAPAATPAPARAAVCQECGIVDSIQVTEQQGEGTGLGAVAGGVAGGLLGSQIGGGSGKKIATVAGAAAGAYGGHQVEKHLKSTKRWDVRVFMEDGSTRTITHDTEPAFKPGDQVRVVDGKLAPR